MNQVSCFSGQSARFDIAEQLAKSILSGRYQPDDALPGEREFSQSLRVSRGTVRSALQMLVDVGLLTRIAGQGTRVRELTSWHLLDPRLSAWVARYARSNLRIQREVVSFRMAVEPFVTGLAAQHANAFDLLALESAWLGMKSAMEAPDRHYQGRSYTDYDVDFHEAIFAASHNLIWTQISHVLKSAIALSVEQSSHNVAALDDSMARHYCVMEAIRLRQPEAATRAAVRVLERTAIDLGIEEEMLRPTTLVTEATGEQP
ncbi:FadR/GntR family transcriptional regulator [Kushneria aurantia]|uniref:FadR/GntR family transcriptional regulator n=1 Tax=Kushneria aurantia TaxID=504092 RepID=A0ABV6G5N2_9GAMM|nr:FCD domain-containing protein [Kushneria aurantia]